MPLNICLISYEFPPMVGGEGMYTYGLSKALSDLGHNVSVITADVTRAGESPAENFEIIRLVPIEKPGLKLFSFNLKAVKKIEEIYKSNQNIDILHFTYDFYKITVSKEKISIPIIATLHHPWSAEHEFIKTGKPIYYDISEVGFIGNSVLLESCSICQLKCPLCSTGIGKNKEGIVGWGYLKFKDFKKFVDSNPGIKNIELSNWGEIFLNPELKHIIEYAYYKNVNLTAGNGVNLNNASKEVLEYLVKYKFKWINISLDGVTNDTYQIYRRGGDFNKVIENVKIINHYKKEYNAVFPKLSWQFVIFGHNEHEIPIAREMAKELGMEFNPRLNWDPSFSPVKDKEFVRRESGLGVASKEEFEQKYGEDYNPLFVCSQLWKSPQINWDGKLLGCCVNIWGDFGNVFEDGLENCLKSEKYAYTRRMLMGREKARDDIPCSNCPTYWLKVRLHDKKLKHHNYIYRRVVLHHFEKNSKKICDNADKLIAVSNYTAESYINEFQVPRDKIEVIPNAVDTSKFHPGVDGYEIRKKLSLSDQDRVVLFVGRLDYNKGIEYLLKSFSRIIKEGVEAKLVIVGEGVLKKYIQKFKRYYPEEIVLVDHISEENLAKFYAAANLIVLPSLMEGLGIVLLEAMASGKPCVATRAGGVEDVVIHGETGLLVPPADSYALYRAIYALLTDDNLSKEFGTAGQKRVVNYFTWDEVAKRTVDVYKTLL